MQLYRRYIAQLSTAYRTRSDIRMFTELLLTLSAVFVFSVFAIRPTLVTIGGLTTEIGEKQETINTMDTKIENVIKAQALYASEGSRLALLDTAVPKESQLVEFVKQIERVASAHSVTVYTMSSGTVPIVDVPAEADMDKRITYSITLSGAYKDLVATLTDIENMRRPSEVASASFSVDESTETASLFLSITGDIPYLTLSLPTELP